MLDFKAMSLEQLQALQKEIGDAIADYEGKRRRAAIEAIHEAARKHGFRLKDLTGMTIRSARRKADE